MLRKWQKLGSALGMMGKSLGQDGKRLYMVCKGPWWEVPQRALRSDLIKDVFKKLKCWQKWEEFSGRDQKFRRKMMRA